MKFLHTLNLIAFIFHISVSHNLDTVTDKPFLLFKCGFIFVSRALYIYKKGKCERR